MKFETLTAALVTLLGDAAALLPADNTFRVIGYPTRSLTGDEVIDSSRLAQVFYGNGEFPMSSGSLTGPVIHEPTYGIELTVSKAAEGDLATLDNPASTPAQIITALAGVKSAEYLANQSWDQAAGLIFDILMNAENQGLGLDQNEVASRWVERFRKEKPLRHGDVVVVIGTIDLSARIEEILSGATPQTLVSIDMGVEVNGDDSQDPIAGTVNDDFTP